MVPKRIQTCFDCNLGQFFRKNFAQFSMEGRVFEIFQKNQKIFKIPKTPKIVPKSIQTSFEQVLGQTFRKFFFRKNCPKLQSKHVWILLGTILGVFGILKFFLIFLKIFEDSTFYGKVGKKIFEKFAPKLVQNTFGYFWERFWAFLEF